MSLKANIEIALNISQVEIKEFHKPGFIRFRICLYYKAPNSFKKIFLTPYSIVNQNNENEENNLDSAFLDQQSFYVYSHKMRIQYHNKPIQTNVTYYFKGYIDSSLLEQSEFKIQADLLFTEQEDDKLQIIKHYQAKIHKVADLLSFLPISFDRFQIQCLLGSFHSILLDYKFERNQDESQFLQRQYENFQQYLQAKTINYRYSEMKIFYYELRQKLVKQLYSLQKRSYEMIKNFGNLQNLQKIKFSKMGQNSAIQNFFDMMYCKQFKTLSNQNIQYFINTLLEDFLVIKMLIYERWKVINQIITIESKQITKDMRQKYHIESVQRFQQCIFSQRIKNHDWTFCRFEQTSKKNIRQAAVANKKSFSSRQHWKIKFPIENQNYFGQLGKQIKIFEEIYETGMPSTQQTEQKQSILHILVLVHGFQASYQDFYKLKQCLESKNKIKVFISTANTGQTEQSIEILGKRLAIQMNQCLQRIKKPYKLSFIGHSMGGIIIRSALIYLSEYRKYLYAYISLCTPHLGYLYSSSKIVKAGLWFINTIQNCQSITELSMEDKQNLRESFLYRLSKKSQLNHFQKISFVSSCQDDYVPFESARVQKNATILTEKFENSIQSAVICEMVDNLLCEVQAAEVSRINVVFSIDDNSFQNFIGRTGHVRCLSDEQFLKNFTLCLSKLFD